MRPLDGVRVLDLTRLLPGAYATLLLADLGADVIKIEDPRGGDTMRTLRGGPSRYFAPLNRGKRSVTLDLRSPEAAAVLDALIAQADVVVESFRPSTARRLGVDAETLRARHPRLIHASISGFGQSGPYVERAAHDINYQALAGLLRPPALPGPLVGDIGSAHQAALAIVAALVERVAHRRRPRDRHLDSRSGAGLVDLSDARPISRRPATTSTKPPTADGWRSARWRRSSGPDSASGSALPVTATHGRRAARELRTRHARRMARALRRHRRLPDASPHAGRGGARSASASRGVRLRRLRGSGETAPTLGADTDAMLEAAGIGAAERERLRAAGVI